jgi:ABC-type Fe3+ transport system permease subunit
MLGYRWLRTTARVAVGLLTVLPAIALVLAVLADRGPDGEPRISLFPIALLAFDPFAWTCASNSLIFATALTALSLIGGVGLGWAISARRFPGCRSLRITLISMLAASPACLALGFLGIWGTRRSWLGPASLRDAAWGSLSLEAWSGWPAWLLWIWASVPSAVALVALATEAALERIRPSWRDAAQLAGAGGLRTWLGMTWPLIRPAAMRAAAILFPLALVEPGAPLVLGLRRTLAFQIVEAATRPEPFPRIAVWAAMAAAFSLAGRSLLRWWGGPPLLDVAERAQHDGRPPLTAPAAGAPRAIACSLIVASSVSLAWAPVIGLLRLISQAVFHPDATADSMALSLPEVLRRALASPIPQVSTNSLLLGLEVGLGVLILAWLLRPDPGERLAPSFAARLVGRFALMPPLVQGVGLLALPGLASLAAVSMHELPGLEGTAAVIANLARELEVERNPWAILSAAVGLSIALRLLQSWRRVAERRPDETQAGLDAALLLGASVMRARAVAALRPGRWIGGTLLAVALASINLTPALLFTPWMDGRTIAPAMLVLADGPQDARLQATALAFFVIAGNLAGLCAGRFAPAPPPEWDPDPS